MSWKSFVSAGLLCVLASPVLADPSLSLVGGGTNANGHLDADGDWIWNVLIAPTSPLPGGVGGTPLAAELGFEETVGEVLTAASLSTAAGDDFDTNNPGEDGGIFGWEADTGVPPLPEGVQVNTALDQVYSALGSQTYTTGGNKDYIRIEVARPVVSLATPNTSTSITVSGSYGAGDNMGRISEYNAAGTTTLNFDTYASTHTRNARGGDADLNGTVNFADFQLNLLLNFNQSGKTWYHGDFDGNGTVNFTDFQILLTQFNTSYTVGPVVSGAGSGGGGAVPEPASAMLMLLAGSLLGTRRFQR